MSDISPKTEIPESNLVNQLTAQSRCEICGVSLVGVSVINKRCSPCFWARSQNQDPKLWKTPKQIEELKNTGALKYDDGKLPLDLLPFEALEEVTLVLQHGAIKYSAHNWRAGFIWSRPFAATLRHLFAFWRGEDLDKDSGLHHLSHAACELLFLLSFVKTKTGTDNRYDNKPNS